MGGGGEKCDSQSATMTSPPPPIKFECCDFENFISEPVETRTHEGYLMKRGALLKAWKQRWFVLDSIKHELRYYEFMEDSHCKGCIDLSEVSAIGSVAAPPGSPKTVEGAFFELKTARRVYNFMANNQKDAQEWIEKIQACLQ
uniref:PH domain-containing protein n=1 Tax=Romanomermis culicivorax TaxID=13658 RepID=A0A915J0J5_ROMCU